MLLVVRIVNQSKGWYECGPNPAPADNQDTTHEQHHHLPQPHLRHVAQRLIRNSEEPNVIEYLKTPPDRETLQRLITDMGATALRCVRRVRPMRNWAR